MSQFRIEHDSMGELKVPAKALYGAQTQRAVDNFPISGMHMPRSFIRALGLIKAAAADANFLQGHLKKNQAHAIRKAALAVAEGQHDEQFPDRRVPDRFGHQHQHECQRGDCPSRQ